MNIFVFGSNLSGAHGAGAAAHASKYHGAVHGQGIGLHGTSYAIPTKDYAIKTLSLGEIKWYVDEFILCAKSHPQHQFEVTRIGCGLAGYRDEQIAPLFKDAPENCRLPHGWRDEYNG